MLPNGDSEVGLGLYHFDGLYLALVVLARRRLYEGLLESEFKPVLH